LKLNLECYLSMLYGFYQYFPKNTLFSTEKTAPDDEISESTTSPSIYTAQSLIYSFSSKWIKIKLPNIEINFFYLSKIIKFFLTITAHTSNYFEALNLCLSISENLPWMH
jgi:hypothetical protein